MNIKYSFTKAIPGYGCRLWILSDWGNYQTSFDKNRKLKSLLDERSMWGGFDKVVPEDANDGNYRVHIKAWEFDPDRWNEENLVQFLNENLFSVEKIQSYDWDSLCEKGNCT